jgi:hypothetical protein
MRRSLTLWIASLLGALWLSAAVVQGQPPAPGSAGATGQKLGSEAVIEVPGPTAPPPRNPEAAPRTEVGPAVPATRPSTATTPDPQAPPAFHVSSLKLDGQVQGDSVQFVVDLDVEINRDDDQFYDVPLRLAQTHILEKKYTGPGRDGPAPDDDDGMHWRFSGAGTHHLQLKLWVPIKRAGGTNSLSISLPQLPAFFDAQFKLRIPGKRIAIRAAKEVLLGETKVTPEATDVTGSVRGTRMELQWNESSVDAPAIGRVTTLMTLKRETDRLVLTGEQSIQRERSSAGEMLIRMPTTAQLVELASPHVRMHEPANGRPGWRRVVLQETAPDRIDLLWTFDMPFPATGGRVTIDGLDVAEARVQEGGVQLADFGTHLAVARLNESQLVRRVDVPSTRTAVPIVNAFEFIKQPFSLALDIQKVQPRYSVRPTHWLLIRADEVLLESAFQVEVENGALSELAVAWPAAKAEGWRIDATSPGLIDLTPAEAESALSTGTIPVRLRSPISGKTEVRLRFRKPLPPMVQMLAWTLPKIAAGRTLPGAVLIAGDDNVLPRVTPDPQAVEDASAGTSLTPPAEFSDLPRVSYRLSPRADGQFKAMVSLKERQIDVSTTVGISREAGRGLHVRQLIRYHVSFGRLTEIRLRLPEQLASRIPVGAESAAISARLGGNSLAPIREESQLRMTLPTPRIGEFEIALEFAFPLEAEATQTVNLDVPLLQPADEKYSSVRCILPDGEGLAIADSAQKWEPIPTAPESSIWFSSSDPQSIPLQVTGSLRQESQRYSIDTAFHFTRFDSSGASVTFAEYHLRTPPARIALTIPERAEQVGFEWNGRGLTEAAGELRTDPSLPGRFLIELRSDDIIGEGKLRLVYRVPPIAGQPWRLIARRTVELPQFPPNVWITRSICELDVPREDHLLQSPTSLLPEFVWGRQGPIWKRNPTQRYLETRARMATTNEFRGIDLSAPGYAYSGMGPIGQYTFTAMNRTLVVLMGAGLSLILGFVFWQFPRTRSAQMLLTLAFAVSFLSLWFLEPIQVLLQPAIFGAVLAVAASLIDTRSRPPVWEEPSLILAPAPSVRDSRPPQQASIQPTAVYQPVTTSSHDLGP